MIRLYVLLVSLLLLLVAAPAWAVDRIVSPTGGGTACSEAQPCTLAQAMSVSDPDDFITLLDGVYKGTNYMLTPPVGRHGTNGHPITVRARNDGEVRFDGEGVRSTCYLQGVNYWTVQGFDCAYSSSITFAVRDAVGIIAKRICAWEAPDAVGNNSVVGIVWDSADTLLEDMCFFGLAVEVFLDFGGNQGTGNVYRRMWIRAEGTVDTGFGPANPTQWNYTSNQHNNNAIVENVITVLCSNRVTTTSTTGCHYGNNFLRQSSTGIIKFYGGIDYYNGLGNCCNGNGVSNDGSYSGITIQDYVTHANGANERGFVLNGGGPFDTPIQPRTAVRLTSIAPLADIVNYDTETSLVHATTLAGTGFNYQGASNTAKLCKRYVDGVYQDGSGGSSNTPLWPWPMDTRIKDAIATNRATGRMSPELVGGAGSGYEAGTVTSEIVSLLGAIPDACNTAASGAAQTLTRSPDSVAAGTSDLTATWSGIPSPTTTDWIGLYTVGSANTAFLDWIYVSCSQAPGSAAAAGSCAFPISSSRAAGTYELRLLTNDGFTSIATSATFTVTAAVSTVRYAGPSGTGTPNDCTVESLPCTIARLLTQLQPGDVGILKNGTYQGASQMLDLSNVPNLSGTAGGTDTCGKDAVPCTPITIRAETDGGVFIDGQFVRTPFNIGLLNAQGQIISTNAYLKFSGFDVGNGSLFVGGGSHFTFQRICASNSQPMAAAGLGTNDHPFSTNYGNTASLYEDICVFGTGRNMVLSSYQSPNSTNVYRRFWMRHEGYGGLDFCDAGPAGQWNYHDNEPYPSIMENVISASTYENLTPGHGCYCPSAPCAGAASVMEASHGNMMGWILYNTDPIRFTLVDGGFFARNFCTNGPGTQTYVDIFADARNHLIRPIVMTSEGGACVTADRLTALQTTSSSLGWNGETTDSFFSNVTPTNYEECTGAIGATGPNIGGCPNFYTGAPGSGGLGSRACFEYQNSTLGSTPLWPWRMDDRIKAALARANAAGTGGSTLAGTFGVGYAANTVTSEIVSRYGAIPDECNRAASGTAPTAPSNLRLGN